MRAIVSKLPEPVKNILRRVKYKVRATFYYGSERYCPVCSKSSRKFRQFGTDQRDDAECAHCGSLERHRFVWLFLQEKTNLFDGEPKKMLHIAPERCFEPRFKKHLRNDYLTADLFSLQAMVRMDITDIQYPDQSFDVILCSHVLEHVPDDKKAMREFFRVLKNNGWAILLVPITKDKTFEDASIIEPEERFKAFGQKDHVRAYGPDYVDRLRDSGFTVEIFQANDLIPKSDAIKMGMVSSVGDIYYCTKEKHPIKYNAANTAQQWKENSTN